MDTRLDSPVRDARKRYDRVLRWALVVSVVLHGLVFLLWRRDLAPLPDTVAAGERAGDAVAAPGGGAMQAIRFAPPREIQVPPPPTRVPELDAPEVVEVEVPDDSRLPSAEVRLAGIASFPGAVGHAGLPGYTGRGDGGADAEGRRRFTAPEPRSIIPEWDPPEAVRGMQVQVRVQIDEYGRPTGRVELRPRTPDAGFNERLVEKVLQMDYKPAYRQGRPVVAWSEMTFVF